MTSFETDNGAERELPLSQHNIDYKRVYFTTDPIRKVAQSARLKGERALKSIRLNARIVSAISFIISKDGRYGTFTDFIEDWAYKGVVTVLHDMGGRQSQAVLNDLAMIRAYDNRVRRDALKQFKMVEVPRLVQDAIMCVGEGNEDIAFELHDDLTSVRKMVENDAAMLAQVDNAISRLETIM